MFFHVSLAPALQDEFQGMLFDAPTKCNIHQAKEHSGEL
jgi:hypothetical protein